MADPMDDLGLDEALRAQQRDEPDLRRRMALQQARRQLREVYEELGQRPVEVEGIVGSQRQRYTAADELRAKQPPHVQALMDEALNWEAGRGATRDQGAVLHEQAMEKLESRAPLMQLGMAAARVPRTALTLGYAQKEDESGLFSGPSRKREREWDSMYQQVIARRLKESDPNLSDEEIAQKIAGGATVLGAGGGKLAWAAGVVTERAVPLALDVAGAAAPIVAATALTGPLAGMAGLEGIAGSMARAGLGAAAYGGARAPTTGEIDAAAAQGKDAGSAGERLKRAAIEGASNALGRAAGEGVRAIPGVGSKLGTMAQKSGAEYAEALGGIVAAAPQQAMEDPVAALADAALFAVAPQLYRPVVEAPRKTLRRLRTRGFEELPPDASAAEPTPDEQRAGVAGEAAKAVAMDDSTADFIAALEGYDTLPKSAKAAAAAASKDGPVAVVEAVDAAVEAAVAEGAAKKARRRPKSVRRDDDGVVEEVSGEVDADGGLTVTSSRVRKKTPRFDPNAPMFGPEAFEQASHTEAAARLEAEGRHQDAAVERAMAEKLGEGKTRRVKPAPAEVDIEARETAGAEDFAAEMMMTEGDVADDVLEARASRADLGAEPSPDPVADAVPAGEARTAASTTEPGMARALADGAREALADEEVAKVKPKRKRVRKADPFKEWAPSDIDHLDELLQQHARAKRLYEATEGDADSPRRTAKLEEMTRAKAQIDDLLRTHDGMSLDDALALPRDSDSWSKSPGLHAVTRWHLGAGPTDARAMEIAAAQESRIADVAARSASVNRIKNREVIGQLAEVGRDAALMAANEFGLKTSGKPRNAAWEKELLAHVKQRVQQEVNSYAKTYAPFVGEAGRAAMGSGEQVYDAPFDPTSAANARDVLQEGAGKVDLGGGESAVIALASSKGGALHGLPEQEARDVASLWLRERALSKGASSQSKDTPGKSLYQIAREAYERENGAGTFTDLTVGKRNAYAKRFERTTGIRDKVNLLHESMRQEADLLRARDIKTKEVGDGSGDVVYLGAGISLSPAQMKGAFSFLGKQLRRLWDTSGEPRYSRTMKDIRKEKPWGWYRHTYDYSFDTGERRYGHGPWANLIDLETRRNHDVIRAEQVAYSDEMKALMNSSTPETQFALANALHGFRWTNDGKELPADQMRGAIEKAVADLPPDQQSIFRKGFVKLRAMTKECEEKISEVRGVKGWHGVRSYFPLAADVAVEGASWRQLIANRFPALWEATRRDRKRYEGEVDDDHARARRDGRPFSRHLIHRTKSDVPAEDVDINPFRAVGRYYVHMARYVGDMRISRYVDKELNGEYGKLRLRPGETTAEALRRFTDPATSPDDAIRIGRQFFRLAELPSGAGRTMRLANIGGTGSIELRNTSREGKEPDYEYRTITFNPATGKWMPSSRGKWHKASVEIKSGGLRHVDARDGFAHKDLVASWEKNLNRVIGKQPVGAVTRALNMVVHWSGLNHLGLFNHPVAIGNTIAGQSLNLSELGAKYYGKGVAGFFNPENRALLKSMGLWDDRISEWQKLGNDAAGRAKFMAGLRTSADKSFVLMRWTDLVNRAVSALGGYMRAKDEMRRGDFQFGHEQQRSWTRMGIKPEDFAETYARQQAMVTSVRVGALMSTVATPALMSSPVGKLVLQFKRPALMFANTGLKMVNEALTKRNFAPLIRFLAVGGLAALFDEMLDADIGSKLGPKLKDVGENSLGVLAQPFGFETLSDIFPALDDQESPWSWVGGMRLPMPDPYGSGPVLTTVLDVSRWGIASLAGNDDEVARQYWEGRKLDQRLFDSWLPFSRQVKTLANAFSPGSSMSDVLPSGDPDRPWKRVDGRGRLTFTTTDEELAKQALFGSVASGRVRENMAFWRRAKRKEGSDKRRRSAHRDEYYDSVLEWKTTGNAEALDRARMLEAEWSFSAADLRREELLRKLPPWGRALTGTNDTQFDTIYSRWKNREKLGTSLQEIRDVLDATIKDVKSLSPDRRASLERMAREL